MTAPAITSFTPDGGPTTGGTTVTITGTDLSPCTAVQFDTFDAISFVDDLSGTTIVAVSPVHDVGGAEISVTTAGGTGVEGSFQYAAPVSATPPRGQFRFYLASLSPAGGIVDEFFPETYSWHDVLNQQGDWNTQLSPGSSIIPRVTAEGSEWTWVTYAVQGGHIHWAGVIETPSWTNGRWTLTGPGLWGYAAKRFILSDISYTGGITAAALAQVALNRTLTNGIGWVIIPDSAQFTDVIKGTVPAANHYSVQQVVEQCAQLSNGIDFQLNYAIDDTGDVTRYLRLAMRVGHQISGSPTPGDGTLAWDHGKHIDLAKSGGSYVADGRNFANCTFVDGGGGGSKPAAEHNASAGDGGRPLIERLIIMNNQLGSDATSTLQLVADAEVLRVGKIATGALIQGIDTELSRWRVGDDVWLTARDTDLDIPGAAYRITEASISVSQNGSVRVPSVVLTDPSLRRPTRRLDGVRELVENLQATRALQQLG